MLRFRVRPQLFPAIADAALRVALHVVDQNSMRRNDGARERSTNASEPPSTSIALSANEALTAGRTVARVDVEIVGQKSGVGDDDDLRRRC